MDLDTVKLVELTLEGREVDFLFIDGGHQYENVSNDFRNYISFVRIGGLVGFHDLGNEPGVEKFFNELDGVKEKSKSWMRCGTQLNELPEKVADDKFMRFKRDSYRKSSSCK